MLSSFDAFFTLILLADGAVELNPIMGAVIERSVRLTLQRVIEVVPLAAVIRPFIEGGIALADRVVLQPVMLDDVGLQVRIHERLRVKLSKNDSNSVASLVGSH